MLEVIPAQTISPGMSDFIVYGSSLALLAATLVAIWTSIRAHRDARRARAALDPDAELVEGHAVVAGTVQHLPDAEHAVKVEIDQVAKEKENSGSWSHKWVEVERQVKVAPFYLLRSNGERIRIEPDEDVFLVDDMDGCIHYNTMSRTRIAELVPDEEVIAVGVLRREIDSTVHTQGYRDAPVGWALSGSRRSPVQLSSEPLEARFAHRRKVHAVAAVCMLATFAAMQLFALGHHARRAGETSVATIESKRHFVTRDSEGDDDDHWEATAITEWGARHVGELEARSWAPLVQGTLVPIRHRRHQHVQFGSEARVPVASAFVCVMFLGISVALYVFSARRARRWYEAKVVDRGEGRVDPNTGLG